MEIDSAESLVDVKEADLVNFNGSNRPFKAYGYFLKPTSSVSSYLPPLFDYKTSNFKSPNYSNKFRWWAEPTGDYCNWVDKLEPEFRNIWIKAGIYEAIMASKHQIRQEPVTLATFCQFWCEETNTFAFPWGEATITLEDVMILGNFPLLGEPVNVVDELSEGALSNMEAGMKQEMRCLEEKSKKGTINQFSWINHYLKSGKGDEIEHIAFLTLWLSKFVLISSRRGIAENLFKVAIHLACGVKVALGYPVLASIYKFLSDMNRSIRSCSTSVLCCMMCAPMNIFQVWVWERFPSLRPKAKSLTNVDMPRMARWTMKGPLLDNLAVTKVIESGDGFIWRPYVMDLQNWLMPSFYADYYGTWYNSNASLDEGLRSYALCLSTCKLVGLSCVEQYNPHRVAMQFGLSQDIPMFIHPTNEDVFENIGMNSGNVMFYVAPPLCKSFVTIQYYNWWKRIELDSLETTRKRKRDKKRKRKGNLLLDSDTRDNFFSGSDAMLTVKRELDSKPNVSNANANKENGHPDRNEKKNVEDSAIMGESIIGNKNCLELNVDEKISISKCKKKLKVDNLKLNQLKDLDTRKIERNKKRKRKGNLLLDSNNRDNFFSGSDAMVTVNRDLDSKPNVSNANANANKESGHPDRNEKEIVEDSAIMGESIIGNKNRLELNVDEKTSISRCKKKLKVDNTKLNQLKNLDPNPNELDATKNQENGHILDGSEKENTGVHQDLSMVKSITENENHLDLHINKEMDISTVNKELEVDCQKINQLKDLDPKTNVSTENENRLNGYLHSSLIENNKLDGNGKENIKVHKDLSFLQHRGTESKSNLELNISEKMDSSAFMKELEEDYKKINQLKEEIKLIEKKIICIESQT